MAMTPRVILAAALGLVLLLLTGCVETDLDREVCGDVAAYVRGEMSRETLADRTKLSGLDPDLDARLTDLRAAPSKVFEIRLDTVAVRCLELADERGWNE